jgi:hypothetical protein
VAKPPLPECSWHVLGMASATAGDDSALVITVA